MLFDWQTAFESLQQKILVSDIYFFQTYTFFSTIFIHIQVQVIVESYKKQWYYYLMVKQVIYVKFYCIFCVSKSITFVA